jgi:heat shock protein HslJ
MKRAFICLLAMLTIFACSCENNDGDNSELAGTNWRLEGWSASSLDPSQFTITAAFDDATISGTSAVNSYSGTYLATSNGDFSVGTLAMTEMAGPEDAMRAEGLYFSLLKQARKYTRNGTTLTLLDENKNELLIFDET